MRGLRRALCPSPPPARFWPPSPDDCSRSSSSRRFHQGRGRKVVVRAGLACIASPLLIRRCHSSPVGQEISAQPSPTDRHPLSCEGNGNIAECSFFNQRQDDSKKLISIIILLIKDRSCPCVSNCASHCIKMSAPLVCFATTP